MAPVRNSHRIYPSRASEIVSAMSSNESYSGHPGGLVRVYRSGDCDASARKRE